MREILLSPDHGVRARAKQCPHDGMNCWEVDSSALSSRSYIYRFLGQFSDMAGKYTTRSNMEQLVAYFQNIADLNLPVSSATSHSMLISRTFTLTHLLNVHSEF